MDTFNGRKSVLQSHPLHRILGFVVFCGALTFVYVVSTFFSPTGDESFDNTSRGIQIFQTIIGLGVASAGLFMGFARREIFYDEKTVEYKTTLFGKSWSRVMDRSLVRDLGPEALGLSHNRNRHQH